MDVAKVAPPEVRQFSVLVALLVLGVCPYAGVLAPGEFGKISLINCEKGYLDIASLPRRASSRQPDWLQNRAPRPAFQGMGKSIFLFGYWY